MRLFTAEEMRSIDARAVSEYGMPSLLLMENAGRAVAERAFHHWRSSDRGGVVAVVCGTGNNGGDGFVAARHLINRGCLVEVYLVGEESRLRGDARVNFDLLLKLGASIQALRPTHYLPAATVVIDALLGTGFKGLPRASTARAIQSINEARGCDIPIVSVDLPSGLDADTGHVPGACVRAAETVTFGGPKPGLVTGNGPGQAGRLFIANISLPHPLLKAGKPSAEWLTGERARWWWPERDLLAHKGDSGRLFVLAGAVGFAGAATMVCEAALRAGAGLVTLGAPRSLVPTVAVKLTEAMTLPLPETAEGAHHPDSLDMVKSRLAGTGALVAGPGFGRDPLSGELLRAVLRECPVPCVVDADGLYLLSPAEAGMFPERCVLTPHPAEMARLLGTRTEEVQSNRLQSAREAAARLGAVLVLKGPGTVIAAPDGRVVVNSTGGPALATGGTGDVLSGMVGACLARGLEPFEAAQAAVYLHGVAGEVAGEDYGAPGAIATDVIEAIPEALRRLRTGETTAPYQFC